MPPKIAIIGAGSLIFSSRLMIDCLTYPALQDAEFALVDIDERRLQWAGRIAERIFREGGFSKARFSLHTDRREALPGCDYIIVSIMVGEDALAHDLNIPMKYGVNQVIGDTTGPGGVFRMLRTAPHFVGIAGDVMDLCPRALVLNYTNPMAMLCWCAMDAQPALQWVGLCHSVQHTTEQWAARLDIPCEDVNYLVAGINHQAWLLRYERNGRDLLPDIRRAALAPRAWKGDTVRCEYVKHFGYPVTESSGHNSEYVQWFRKRPELVEKYCENRDPWAGESLFILKRRDRSNWEAQLERMASGADPLDMQRSEEYGSTIINAHWTNQPAVFYGNLRNNGLIDNLPPRAVVEVPVTVDRNGFRPMKVGALPAHLAAINVQQIAVHELAVRSFFQRDPELLFQALALDPLTSAVCSLDEIRDMVADMLEAGAPWLPEGFPPVLERKPKIWESIPPDEKGEEHCDPASWRTGGRTGRPS